MSPASTSREFWAVFEPLHAVTYFAEPAQARYAEAGLRAAAEAAPTGGRALGAANAALPWPERPIEMPWQAATVLRETRGDGHVAAQLACGLDGLRAMVLRCGDDLTEDLLKPHRGWSDEERAGAGSDLVDAGLLDQRGRVTAAGRDVLRGVEEITDALALAPWTAVGGAATRELVQVAAPLADLARAQLPALNPIGLPTR